MTKVERNGWEIVRLQSDEIGVEVVPDRGGEILTACWLPRDIDILWRSPWGLRTRDNGDVPTNSYGAFIESYPGGWQTLFPNGGAETTYERANHSFHGEAWRARCATVIRDGAVEMTSRLATIPFAMTKRISLDGGCLTLEETARYLGSDSVEVMWIQHPAFGRPFLSGRCRIEADARTFVTDDERDVGDLAPGRTTVWPFAETRSGERVDLRPVPDEEAGIERLGYLTDFEHGRVRIDNPDLRIRAELSWSKDLLPYAWMWLDANGSRGYPTFGRWYVLAIEPASSYPAQGLAAVDRKTKTLLTFAPGEERTISVSLTVSEW